jgi:GNAT superfamily N-acetyltransferase
MNPAPLQIRPAGDGDVASLAALTLELGYAAQSDAIAGRLRAVATDARQALLVAEQNGAVVGWLQINDSVALESGRRAEIVGLVVSASVRRQGVGRALVAAAEDWARARGIDRLVVRSNLTRSESHRFYPDIGFAPVKHQAVYVKRLEG